MQATNRTRKLLTALSIVLFSSTLIGAAALQSARQAATTPVAAPTLQAPTIGVPTGEFQNGVAVYRLPPIAVTLSRSEALARMAQEDAVAMK